MRMVSIQGENPFKTIANLANQNSSIREVIVTLALKSAVGSFATEEGFEKAVILFHGKSIFAKGFDHIIQFSSPKSQRYILIVVEAKLVGKNGQLRTYLPFRKSIGRRQMSKTWMKYNADYIVRNGYPKAGGEVLKALDSGKLERLLIVINYRTGDTKLFWEEDFLGQKLDDDLLSS